MGVQVPLGHTLTYMPTVHARWPPLLEHARERHASSDGQRLRYRNGRRITFRRYDLLPERLGRYLSWIRTQFSPDADLVRLGKVGKMIMPRLPGTAC
jgi:hypothetical protein